LDITKDSFVHRHLTPKLIDGVIVPSNALANQIAKSGYIDRNIIKVIPIGITEKEILTDKTTAQREVHKRYNIPEGRKLAVIVGRFVDQKGHKYLIDAFYRARQKNRSILLLIVGDGELKDELRQQVKERGLEETVIFTGYREDTERILSIIDIFVHPSLWEGFGLSILEAMSKGKAVIATKLSAIPELVIDGETGVLVPSKKTNPLSKKILELSENTELRNRFGNNGRERWKKMFSVDKMIRETGNYYDELLTDI